MRLRENLDHPGKHEVALRVFLIVRAPLGLIKLKFKVNRISIYKQQQY